MAYEPESLQIAHARRIVRDLLTPRPWIYWTDLLVSLTIAYSAAALYMAEPLSPAGLAGFVVAGFGLYRVSLFMHEIVHFRQGEMTALKVAWNILAGIPMMMPSFLYESHISHHNAHHYGTANDGEYLPLGHGGWKELGLYLVQMFALPILVTLRFLIVTPVSFLRPAWRQLVLERMSSFVINFSYRRTIPESAPRRAWAAMEIACCLRAAAIFACVAVGLTHWTRIPALYCLAVFALGLNHIRTLAAHRYASNGEKMSHAEQLEDSVNITGGWLTELFFPVGLRYHALHHLFPSIPYHNMGRAHRRLIAQLPAGSLYHQVTYPTALSVFADLLLACHRHDSDADSQQRQWYARRDQQRRAA